ncbi:MAG: NAD-dependent epimerase/dehydratase family protein [Acidimicrobiia bacterium]|nr:NAD-dependent epimerase/dehydratase family protein [Acidimicrobiia bacterium]NNC75049.1 NAD-dependent epimerase/dehydratase family protein [Acidimicrobiia bacterium]
MKSGVFVTGGTGFIGGALLSRITDGPGWVKALARSRTGGETVSGLGALPVIGDLFDMDSLREGMDGCGLVYHVAGVNQMCPTYKSEMYRANVEGTRNVIRAAADAGVARVVYTSSAATIGEAQGTVGNEDSEHRGSFLSDYEQSKHDAEIVAMQTATELGVDLVVVNPSSVQGPGRATGSARILLYPLNRRFPVTISTHVSVIDIEDCVTGHVLAAERGEPGRRYVLSGATVTVREAISLLADLAGSWRMPLPVPRFLASSLGMALAGPASRRPDPVLCPAMVRTLLHGHRYDGSRATAELGLEYTPIRRSLDRTIRWLVDYGFVFKKLPGYPKLDG